MSERVEKILFVLSYQLTDEAIYKKIRSFRGVMGNVNALDSVTPEYFLLYVGLNVPAYALQTESIVAYAAHENNLARQRLTNVGRILNIPCRNQHKVVGHADLEALRVAKLLGVDKVFGYSSGFLKLRKRVRRLSQGIRCIKSLIRKKRIKEIGKPKYKPGMANLRIKNT